MKDCPMCQTNYDISLYNTPVLENLVNELQSITKQKREIYSKIRSEQEYFNKLSFEERSALKYLSEKENKTILEILALKSWISLPEDSIKYFIEQLGSKYDSYAYPEKEDYRSDILY